MRKLFRLSLLITFAGIVLAVPSVGAQQNVTVPSAIVAYPDMIVYNGKIVTMNDSSYSSNLGKIGQAMSIRDGKIQAVGSTSEILSYAGPKTVKIDLHGRTVIPGIIDSHTHIHNYAVATYATQHPEVVESMFRQFSVTGTTDDEFTKGIELILKEKMDHAPKGQWAWISLPNGGSSGSGPGVKYVQDESMTQAKLDKLAPNTPVLLMSHPAYLINSAGKKYINDLYATDLGYDLETDPNGYGNLTDYTRSLMVDSYFADKIPVLADIVRQEMEKWAADGITTFSSHITGLRFMDAYMYLVRHNTMPMRFAYTNYFGFEGNADPQAFYSRLGDMAGLGGDYLWTTGFGLAEIDDGPPMICTTIFDEHPDLKKRAWCRIELSEPYEKGIEAALKAHERLAVGHIWGDKGLDDIFQVINNVMKEDPSITKDYIRSRHFSSDHCGVYPRPDQIPMLKDWGFMLSCNANAIERDAPWFKTMGPEATKKYGEWVSPVKSLLAAGVPVVYEHEGGVDQTYMSTATFLLTRKYKGEEYGLDQAIDRITLMKMMTVWPAAYVLKANELGTLEPGKFADFVVLNKDYFTIPENDLPNVYPLMTVLEGKPVFWRAAFAAESGHAAVGPQLKYNNLPKGDPAAVGNGSGSGSPD